MKYDYENDRLISETGEIKIYPSGYDFPSSSSVEIEIDGESITLRDDLVRVLADGILNAAERLGV